MDTSQVNTILATDCGSTTTKAILIERTADGFRLVCRGESPTTVEAPFDDVTVGVLTAVREVEELTGRTIVRDNHLVVPSEDEKTGVDLYVSTSSAGGGLQMTVAGVVSKITAESAERAALGAGAIVMDVVSIDDGRAEHERIEQIRRLRPDMILLAGGTDGGQSDNVLELAEFILAADPQPRLGRGFKLPVIYAGNRAIREDVGAILGQAVDLRVVDNIRPSPETENLGPSREAIHELFLEHVMEQAPGYHKLKSWTSADLLSTPNAVGMLVQETARQKDLEVLAVDIGGATTDVFSVFQGQFTRTVSANLGMSYSICNVLAAAGTANVLRWLPLACQEDELRNHLRNKMIRPTTVPQTLASLAIEQALAREALRLALVHHRQLATSLKGLRQETNVGRALDQGSADTLVNMVSLDLVIGSGGVLSHAPRRAEAALMMLDAFGPEGFTELAVDSIFMMPQLGVLGTVLPEAATEVFERDCLVPLGTSLAPRGETKGAAMATVSATGGLSLFSEPVLPGTIKLYPLGVGQTAEVTVTPARGVDVGAGPGRELTRTVTGGVVGFIVDGRGRPLKLPAGRDERVAKLAEWSRAMGIPVAEG
ncbi:MAG: glutamate mutase L [Armatimonadetes bacterium]|nr:glutamate mutase L [Armatimonadota bacterium]